MKRRLILVPQYPTPLRYQEWWIADFVKNFSLYFDVLVLNPSVEVSKSKGSNFAPIIQAVEYEMEQIRQYMQIEIKDDDILLLNDLSFPGLFSQVLLHKKPKKCYAFCHATSKNRYDYFAPVRHVKYPIEKSQAKLFDTVFVASQYHAKKLGWDNIKVVGLPFYPFSTTEKFAKQYDIISVARKGIQKRTKKLEKLVESHFNVKIYTPEVKTWAEYFRALNQSKILLVTSKEETYGYQVIDALQNNCIPIAPNSFSFPELLSKNYLYNNEVELLQRIKDGLGSLLQVPELPKDKFYQNIVNEMIE